MKNQIFIAIIISFLFNILAIAQQEGIDALKKDYPQLMEKFGHELENQRADYYFLVDVSGTMYKYKDIVVPALQEFFRPMQTGDYVSVIKFGGEAKNDIGSQGMVNDDIRNSLIEYVPNLYRRPDNPLQRELYFRYTDLEEMLLYLRKELRQAGRNNLKFIFIITDFIHDPTASKKGNEDWDAIQRMLKNEQSENYLNVFALLLSGEDEDAGRDLDKVMNVFPVNIELEEVRSSAAISEWFKHKKNSILLDKFTALIKTKIKDAEIEIKPEFTIDGDLTLQTSWQQNELFDKLQIDQIRLGDNNFKIKPKAAGKQKTPEGESGEEESESETQRRSGAFGTLESGIGEIKAGKVEYKSVSFPLFHKYNSSIGFDISLVAPYTNELVRLGIEQDAILYKTTANKCIFTFCVPFLVALAALILMILYAALVIYSAMRNSKAANKINGQFAVRFDGDNITSWKKANAERVIDIGIGATFLPVVHPDCNWLIEIVYVTYNPFKLKKPSLKCRMTKGNRFKTGGNEYLNHQEPKIFRWSKINIGEFYIQWKQ